MDEISQGPGRDFRVPPGARRWLTVIGAAGAVGVVAAVAVFGVTRGGGRHGAGASGGSAVSHRSDSVIVASAGPGAPIAAVPNIPAPTLAATLPDAAGTVLLTCDSVVWRQPDPNWQAGSLQIGTMWLLGGRHLGYARLGRAQPGGGHAGSGGTSRDVEMLVHIGAGSTVVMRAATGVSPYFEFLNSPATTGDFQGLDGGRGFTFVPCPAPDLGYGGLVPFYDVGFSIVPGHTASVEVWTSPSARPVWLTFTAPRT